eukprot:TRINITY_DN5488_c0_g2_i1.p1 TRINITY_DN5488_c0_g2~~TRINITY_DN5488_c0_g2_i1.p1  ORF type:complete len:368 (-),score=87.99 TRINITY_DN5488_c0_g2_i1:79-1092(-)
MQLQQQQQQQQQQKFQRSPIREPVQEPAPQEQGAGHLGPPRHPFHLQTNQIDNLNANNNNENNNNNVNNANDEIFNGNNNNNNTEQQQQQVCESQPSLNWSIRNELPQNGPGVDEKSLGELGLGVEKGVSAKRPSSPLSNTPPPAKKIRKNNNFTSPFVMAASQGNGAESNISKPQSTESISNGNFQEDLPKSDSLGDFNFTPSMEEFGRMDTQDLLRQCAIGNSGLFPGTSSAFQNFQGDTSKIQSLMNVFSSEFPDFKSFSIGLFSSLMQSAILPQNENENYRNHEIQEEGEDDGSGGIPTPMRNDIQEDQIEGHEGSLNDGNAPGNALIKEELE